MSPTPASDATAGAVRVRGGVWVGEGCTRGMGDRVGAWEGYTGTQPDTLLGPIFNIFSLKARTHGQMKAFLEVS